MKRHIVLESFWRCVPVALLVTAAAKLLSAARSDAILALPHAFLPGSNRTVMMAAAFMELLVLVLIRDRRPVVRATVLLWMSAVFLFFRAMQTVVAPLEACGCLGTIHSWMGLSTSVADTIGLFLLGAFIAGAIVTLFDAKRQGVRALVDEQWEPT